MHEVLAKPGPSRDAGAFATDGVVCVRGAVDPAWVARLQDAIADAMATPPPHANRYGAKSGGSGVL